MKSIEELVLPRNGKDISKELSNWIGSSIKKLRITTVMGKKTLGMIVFTLKPKKVVICPSLAKRMHRHLKRLERFGIKIILSRAKKGRKKKLYSSLKELKDMFTNKKISRRTYFYRKKEFNQ